MAISIISGHITVIQAPAILAPTLELTTDGLQAAFNGNETSNMHAEGTMRFNGAAADPRVGWDIGWIQAQWIETNWAHYRGEFDREGSVFLQRGRPPARPQQACRDTSFNVANIFKDPTKPEEFQHIPAGPFPLDVRVEINDPPREVYPALQNNSLTGRRNFLHEVQLELHFCTVLTVRDPAGTFHHQAHFFWYMHWQSLFVPLAFPDPTEVQWKITPVAEGNSTRATGPYPGTPTDPFIQVLTSEQSHSCNDLADISRGPACRREYTNWNNVDVKR